MYIYDFKLITSDKNAGTVYLPSESTVNIPIIIYCHGWGADRGLYPTAKILCEKAAKKNIGFVTFDFFGCGETGGDYSQMTYSRWVNNFSEIVSWVTSQPFCDKNKIGCLGYSSGSTVALRFAMEDKRLSYIVSIATCISAHILMKDNGPIKLFADNTDLLFAGGTVKLAGIDFGVGFYLDVISNAPMYSMDKINCPVLFLQGTADTAYRCADAKMAYDLIKEHTPDTQSTHIPVENGNHGLDNVPDEAVDKIMSWLAQTGLF
jgi:pimeloyl-ACP methyl ester carboxylesterase